MQNAKPVFTGTDATYLTQTNHGVWLTYGDTATNNLDDFRMLP